MDVSVIIPVYNSEKYLSACIDSVLHQEKVSLEIILVDDGSTDSSASICDVYAQDYKNIRAIHIKNSGQAVAKNEGLKYAQGNYIALTDSDDKMTPRMLYTMITAGYNHDARKRRRGSALRPGECQRHESCHGQHRDKLYRL